MDNLNRLYTLRSNYSFKEKGTDLLIKMYNSKSARDLLETHGYKKTTMEKYNYENFNSIESDIKENCIKKEYDSFVDFVELFSKDSGKKIYV